MCLISNKNKILSQHRTFITRTESINSSHSAINAHNFMRTDFGIKNTQYFTAFTQGLKHGIQFL